jgi:hypothetical protein
MLPAKLPVSVRMIVRMTAYHVPTASEMTNVLPGQESSPPNKPGRNEEVTTPAATAQLITDQERALPAIIESQEQVTAGAGEIDIWYQTGPQGSGRDLIEVLGEPAWAQLEGQDAIPLKP